MPKSNLFVSYDLHKPDDNYEQVIAAIKGLGAWAKVEYSLWYLRTSHNAEDVKTAVWSVMHPKDKLIVINTTNNSASWNGLSSEVAEFIRNSWNS